MPPWMPVRVLPGRASQGPDHRAVGSCNSNTDSDRGDIVDELVAVGTPRWKLSALAVRCYWDGSAKGCVAQSRNFPNLAALFERDPAAVLGPTRPWEIEWEYLPHSSPARTDYPKTRQRIVKFINIASRLGIQTDLPKRSMIEADIEAIRAPHRVAVSWNWWRWIGRPVIIRTIRKQFATAQAQDRCCQDERAPKGSVRAAYVTAFIAGYLVCVLDGPRALDRRAIN